MKGIAIRTDFIGLGSFVKIADDLYSTAHWVVSDENIVLHETEIALFRNKSGDSFVCGTVVAVLARDYERGDSGEQERKVIIFELKDEVVSRNVFSKSMNIHRYEMDGSQYVASE